MEVNNEIAKKAKEYALLKKRADFLYKDLKKYAEENGFRDVYIDDFDVSEKPTGEEQGGGKYCDQHMSGEDCGYGTYFLPIEKNGVYLAIYYSF